MQVWTSANGQHWEKVGELGPLWWPQVFRCASGVYVIGNEGPIDAVTATQSNDLFVSKMLDQHGARCAPAHLRLHVCEHVC
jgi:hypothetical protein